MPLTFVPHKGYYVSTLDLGGLIDFLTFAVDSSGQDDHPPCGSWLYQKSHPPIAILLYNGPNLLAV